VNSLEINSLELLLLLLLRPRQPTSDSEFFALSRNTAARTFNLGCNGYKRIGHLLPALTKPLHLRDSQILLSYSPESHTDVAFHAGKNPGQFSLI
jgi:hypothetical protein